jgi:hypothetical protein
MAEGHRADQKAGHRGLFKVALIFTLAAAAYNA